MCSSIRVAAWCKTYVSTVQQLMGISASRVWVYTGAWFWNPQAGGSAAVGNHPLWVSGYVKSPPMPKVRSAILAETAARQIWTSPRRDMPRVHVFLSKHIYIKKSKAGMTILNVTLLSMCRVGAAGPCGSTQTRQRSLGSPGRASHTLSCTHKISTYTLT